MKNKQTPAIPLLDPGRARLLVATWLGRLIHARHVRYGRKFFVCFSFACSTSLFDTAKWLMDSIADFSLEEAFDDFQKACEEDGEASEVFFELLDNLTTDELLLADCLSKSLEKHLKKEARRYRKYEKVPYPDWLGLSEANFRICEFTFFKQHFKEIEDYFEDEINIHTAGQLNILATMLDIPVKVLSDGIAQLNQLGFLTDDDYFRLTPAIVNVFNGMTHGEVDGLFWKNISGESLPIEDFLLEKGDLDQALALLKSKSQRPVHILLYGPGGSGKTALAASLAKEAGLNAYSVVSRANDDDDGRRRAVAASFLLATQRENNLVVIDEAERMLKWDPVDSTFGKDRAWIDDCLDPEIAPGNTGERGKRAIWIVNEIDSIDQAILNRFAFSIQFTPLSPGKRQTVLMQIVKRYKAGDLCRKEDARRIARDWQVPLLVLENAVAQAAEMTSSRKDFLAWVDRACDRHLVLANNGRPYRKIVSDSYSLDAVSCGEPVERLLQRCRKAATLMDSKDGIVPGSVNLLFHGLPGTGKTALASHIADELGLECQIERASSLLDSYVGVTEQKIAAAFARAEERHAVLVFDEVDSFLSSRHDAMRSWEASMVNEFLTCLEECRTICICTTNLRDRMDPAAMRRFSHKVKFSYAGPEQVMILYKKMLSCFASGKLTPDEEARLTALHRLTPGDFTAVRNQLALDSKKSSHGEIIDALVKEQRMKLDKSGGNIGFTNSLPTRELRQQVAARERNC